MKNKIIKLLLTLAIVLPMFTLSTTNVAAASMTVTVNKTSVSAGATFTATVKITNGSGMVKVSLSNGTFTSLPSDQSQSDSSQFYIDGSSTFTIKAGTSGNTVFTATPVAVYDYDTEAQLTGAKSATVKITTTSSSGSSSSGSSSSGSSSSGSSSSGSSSNSSSNTTTTPADTRSKVNTLSSITVEGASLDPTFNAETTKYTVNVSSDVKEVTISAKSTDAKATVSGYGKKAVSPGSNTFDIVCTAENGSKKTYTLTINVDESPTTFIEKDGESLGFVTNFNGVNAPSTFEETTITYNEEELKAWSSETYGVTIVCLVNDEGVKNFYQFKDGAITSIFKSTTLLGRNIVVVDLPEDLKEVENMTFKMITIDGVEVPGWVYNDENLSHYAVIYVLDDLGNVVYYQWNQSENSLQIIEDIHSYQMMSLEVETSSIETTVFYIVCAIAGIFSISTLVLAYLYFKGNR